MAINKRKPVKEDFWYITDFENDPTLYQDQLGRTIPLKVESGGYTKTYDVWQNLMENPDIRGIGWDLCCKNGKDYELECVNLFHPRLLLFCDPSSQSDT